MIITCGCVPSCDATVSFLTFTNRWICLFSRSSYKSDGVSSSEAHRLRRRSFSITPEIGDDIVRLIVGLLCFLIWTCQVCCPWCWSMLIDYFTVKKSFSTNIFLLNILIISIFWKQDKLMETCSYTMSSLTILISVLMEFPHYLVNHVSQFATINIVLFLFILSLTLILNNSFWTCTLMLVPVCVKYDSFFGWFCLLNTCLVISS